MLTEQLLDAIYDGGLKNGEWRPALGALRDDLDSAEIAFIVFNRKTPRPELWETTGNVLTRAACDAYRNDYLRLDPKLAILAQSGPGFVFNDAEHFDDAFVAHDPFYQGYSLPLGMRHTLDLYAGRHGEAAVYLAAMRTAGQGPFDDVAAARLRTASTHFIRALRARSELTRAEAVARQAAGALDALDFGIAVVDGNLRLSFANAFARDCLDRGVPFRLVRGRLESRPAIPAVVSAIRQCACGRPSTRRLVCKEDWLLSLIPLSAGSPIASSGASAMLVFRPASAEAGLAADELRALYGLTRSEAELAVEIAQGTSLSAFAARRHIGISTVRWHMLNVLRKMGARRQADVVRLVSAMPSLHRPN